jgi:hypothetical protein
LPEWQEPGLAPTKTDANRRDGIEAIKAKLVGPELAEHQRQHNRDKDNEASRAQRCLGV